MVHKSEAPASLPESAAVVGEVSWYFTMPPHGVNYSHEIAKWTTNPHLYKRTESKQWEKYAKTVTGSWTPPARVALTVLIEFAVTSAQVRRVDADKWAAAVIDGVIGSRFDQWIDHLTVTKQAVPGEGGVAVTVRWEQPTKKRRRPAR